MKLSDYYKDFFESIPHTRQDFLHGLTIALYVIIVLGYFAFAGPVSDIVWGFPTLLSMILAFVGTPIIAVLLWPVFVWANDKIEDDGYDYD